MFNNKKFKKLAQHCLDDFDSIFQIEFMIVIYEYLPNFIINSKNQICAKIENQITIEILARLKKISLKD
ncbi:hypothetical protein BpHYR1_049135 [Brachionus plicatilis]|uniref:Uncharacterized protein n=1 Tax=Brachionus plicatilis TaxID=10195 RepID=A0A3M7SL46_BRAPC|nr:hypothetical protein BpHYR1_049135 [Brachionus plicatilis]